MKSKTSLKTNHQTPKTILVTGGAGFIGSHVVDALLERGDLVVIVDDFNDFYDPGIKRRNLLSHIKNPKLKITELDIRSPKLDQVFKKYSFDAVVHLAARAGVRPSIQTPKLYWDVNVLGTLNLLESMRKHKVSKLVFASSSSVYGNRESGPFKETDSTDSQVSPYGASKKSAELLCSTYAHLYQINTTVLRFFTVYGPRNRPDLACMKFMEAMFNRQPIHQYGDGKSGRDYTYVTDTVDGILKSLDSNWGYEIINLGNSHPVNLKQMISIIAKTIGETPTVYEKEFQAGDVELTFADIKKAKKLLGWEPKVSFTEGIARLCQWYKSI